MYETGDEPGRLPKLERANVAMVFELERARCEIDALREKMKDNEDRMADYHEVFRVKEKMKTLLKARLKQLLPTKWLIYINVFNAS